MSSTQVHEDTSDKKYLFIGPVESMLFDKDLYDSFVNVLNKLDESDDEYIIYKKKSINIISKGGELALPNDKYTAFCFNKGEPPTNKQISVSTENKKFYVDAIDYAMVSNLVRCFYKNDFVVVKYDDGEFGIIDVTLLSEVEE